eukprot:518705-Pelagomonas_calceolata.AAC.3
MLGSGGAVLRLCYLLAAGCSCPPCRVIPSRNRYLIAVAVCNIICMWMYRCRGQEVLSAGHANYDDRACDCVFMCVCQCRVQEALSAGHANYDDRACNSVCLCASANAGVRRCCPQAMPVMMTEHVTVGQEVLSAGRDAGLLPGAAAPHAEESSTAAAAAAAAQAGGGSAEGDAGADLKARAKARQGVHIPCLPVHGYGAHTPVKQEGTVPHEKLATQPLPVLFVQLAMHHACVPVSTAQQHSLSNVAQLLHARVCCTQEDAPLASMSAVCCY